VKPTHDMTTQPGRSGLSKRLRENEVRSHDDLLVLVGAYVNGKLLVPKRASGEGER